MSICFGKYTGSKATFLCYGIASLLVLIGYIALNHFTMEISLAHTTKLMQNNNDTDIDVVSGDSNYSLGKREHALHNASFPISPHGEFDKQKSKPLFLWEAIKPD